MIETILIAQTQTAADLIQKADYLRIEEKYLDALDSYEQAYHLQIKSQETLDYWMLYHRADLTRWLVDWQQGQDLFLEAIVIYPNGIELKLKYAEGLIARGQRVQAQEIIDEILNLDPHDEWALYLKEQIDSQAVNFSFQSNFARPDERSIYSGLLNHQSFQDNTEVTVQTGITIYTDPVNDFEPVTNIPFRFNAEGYLDSNLQGAVTLGADITNTDWVYPYVGADLTFIIDNDTYLSFQASHQAVLESPEAIQKQLTQTTFTGSFNTSLGDFYLSNWNQVIAVSDGNLGIQGGGRLSYQVFQDNPGLLELALNSYYRSFQQEGFGYWTPDSYVNAGLEARFGFKFTDAFTGQVGIMPGFAYDSGDIDFILPFGAVFNYQISEDISCNLQGTVAYGVSTNLSCGLNF